MTRTFPNLVRLLVVLAMVCGFVVATVTPAAAVEGGTPKLTRANATPATAGEQVGWEFVMQPGQPGNLTAGDTITITFPDECTLPSSISKSLISITGTATYVTADFSQSGAADPAISGQQVIITIPPSGFVKYGGDATIRISQAAGITAPNIAYTAADQEYQFRIATSQQTTGNTTYAGFIPKLSINPKEGDRNTQVTVTGKGWRPNQSITIGGALTGTGLTAADGTFSLTASPTGVGTAVSCLDGTGRGTSSASTTVHTWHGVTEPTFTLKARVTVDPTEILPGGSFTIYGYDFSTEGYIDSNTVLVAGSNMTHSGVECTTIDAYGDSNDCQITIANGPYTTYGAKQVTVTDKVNGPGYPEGAANNTAYASITIKTPTVTVDPASAAPGTMVTISGSNFDKSGSIAIGSLTIGGTAWNDAAITIDGPGSWTYSKKIPTAAKAGTNAVIATSANSAQGKTAVTVGSRALTLNPTSGPSGTQVTVSGSGMTASGTIAAGSLTFAGTGWNTSTYNSGAMTIDSLGNVEPETLRVPTGSTIGANTVQATDSGGLTTKGTFTVTQPTIEVTPTTGYKGDTVTVHGTGWVPGTLGLVTVTFNNNTKVTSTPDANGEFTAQFAIPLNANSGQLIGASDSYNNSAAPVAFIIGDPVLSIDPTTGPVGTNVTVSGQGFQPQSAVSALTIGGGSVLGTTTVVTDAVGAFATTFMVPGLATGAQTVSATVSGTTASTFFTITEAPPTVATALNGISEQLVRVWGYNATDGWQMYDPADTVGSDLESLVAGEGYWIKVTEDTQLIYGGNTYNFTAGWNLKGWQG